MSCADNHVFVVCKQPSFCRMQKTICVRYPGNHLFLACKQPSTKEFAWSFCGHIWIRYAQYRLSGRDGVVGDYFPPYKSFPTVENLCSINILAFRQAKLIPPLQIFTAKTNHDAETGSNNVHSLRVPLLRRIFDWTDSLRNRLPRVCFPYRIGLNHCKFFLSATNKLILLPSRLSGSWA